MQRNTIVLALATSLALPLMGIGAYALISTREASSVTYRWEAVTSELPVGKTTRVELKLVSGDGVAQVGDVRLNRTRLDMGPDGMEAMEAPLTPVEASADGSIAFETELVMAGSWAFSVEGEVEGLAAPVSGTVLIKAVDDATAEPAEASAQSADRTILYYRNPMGLPDTSPVPTKDWMGMDYLPVYADEANDPPGTVRVSAAKIQRAGVRTEPAKMMEVMRPVRAFGSIVTDESRIQVLTAKFSGYVEKLFVGTTGERVKRGGPLMQVFIDSPEMLQKLQVLASAARANDKMAIEINEFALRSDFALSDETLDRIKATYSVDRSILLRSPIDGTVMQKPAMTGKHLSPGEMVFEVADLSSLWVVAEIPERDLALVREGDAATITLVAYDGAAIEGTVDFIYPDIDMAMRTGKIRIVLPNQDGRLRPGLFAEVRVETAGDGKPKVAVPDAAVIDSGKRRVVFVAMGDGVFEPRPVELGRRGDGMVEIVSGVEAGEEVVVAGNFLIDAESNLNAALAGIAAAESKRNDRPSYSLVRRERGSRADRRHLCHPRRHLCGDPYSARRYPRSLRHSGHRLYRISGPGAAGSRRSGHLPADQRAVERAELARRARLLLLRRVFRLRHFRRRNRYLLGQKPRA